MEEGQKNYVMSYLGRPIDENLIFNGYKIYESKNYINIFGENESIEFNEDGYHVMLSCGGFETLKFLSYDSISDHYEFSD